jgi:DnaJ-class molecular chaperone
MTKKGWQGGRAGQDNKIANRGQGRRHTYMVSVKCPTCRGKGTKGYDKNGPKQCGLCGGQGTIQVEREP